MGSFFFFNATSTTEIYTLSLHDALPICGGAVPQPREQNWSSRLLESLAAESLTHQDRKSTRLNSSHQIISYAVFCLKKKNKKKIVSLQTRPTTKISNESDKSWKN